jgi:crotonobetainyl-CoA hydratase
MSIEVVRNGAILEVTINRPKANAIDAATSREMSSVFDSFMRDPELRVAILTGAGTKFFSAGWDLSAANDGESFESDYGVGGFGGISELKFRPKPVIAAAALKLRLPLISSLLLITQSFSYPKRRLA